MKKMSKKRTVIGLGQKGEDVHLTIEHPSGDIEGLHIGATGKDGKQYFDIDKDKIGFSSSGLREPPKRKSPY
jgi:hypothetical protein